MVVEDVVEVAVKPIGQEVVDCFDLVGFVVFVNSLADD